MTFYQSAIWREIQEIIYEKPTFTIELFGKEYFWVKKIKKIWPIHFTRYQVLGITLPEDQELVKQEIKKIQKDFKKKGKNILFQRGVTNEIVSFDVNSLQEDEFYHDMRASREFLKRHLKQEYNLCHSFRENMPESTIIQCLHTTDDFLANMNEGARDRAKKAIKKGIEFTTLKESEYDLFYHKRKATAGKKWFNIIPQDQYERLITHLIKTGKGEIFITKEQGEIVAGTIGLYDKEKIICLYGFADRKHPHSGGQQYLKYRLFERAKEKGYRICDMFWGAPTGYPEHELAGVSAFKESTGGIKIEYYGNFDIILDPFLYKTFKRYYRRKK